MKKRVLLFLLFIVIIRSSVVSALDLDCNYKKYNSTYQSNDELSLKINVVDQKNVTLKTATITNAKSSKSTNLSGYSLIVNFPLVNEDRNQLFCAPILFINDSSKVITLYNQTYTDPSYWFGNYPIINISSSDTSDSAISCYDYKSEATCVPEEKIETSTKDMEKQFSCVWVTKNTPGYCNVDKLQYVKCGGTFDIPEQAPRIMSFAINLLKIGTPIILILTGILTLVKAVAASKEDEIKKAQSTLIRKVIASAFVFLVIVIVQFVILKVADSSDTSGITSCLSCFLNNDCDKDIYFKTKVGDDYVCHLVSDPSKKTDCGENRADSESNTSPSNESSSGRTHEGTSGSIDDSSTHESSSGRTHGGSSGSVDDSSTHESSSGRTHGGTSGSVDDSTKNQSSSGKSSGKF